MWPRFATLVALYGATAGYAALLGVELCANQACCALVSSAEAVSFTFLIASSALERFQQQTRGSAQQNLSQSIVADLPTVLPPKDILAVFDCRVRPLLSRCIQDLEESFTLATIRDAILPKLLSDEIRVLNAEKRIEEVIR
jgi:type I restriction enzyme S subunit